MRLTWITDPHLEFLDAEERHRFYATLEDDACDALIVTGDIAVATSLVSIVSEFAEAVGRPIYFVLGNHDFYGSSLATVRASMMRAFAGGSCATWLSGVDPVPLSSTAFLVGDDGWYDARHGRPLHSRVELNDFHLIGELVGSSGEQRVRIMQSLGDEAAARLDDKLVRIPPAARHVVVATHVPPFRGAAWHQGAISGPDFLPWFSCRAIGDVLLRFADERPTCEVLVLCGHTHSSGFYQPSPNLRVWTAGAEYGEPAIAGIVTCEEGWGVTVLHGGEG